MLISVITNAKALALSPTSLVGVFIVRAAFAFGFGCEGCGVVGVAGNACAVAWWVHINLNSWRLVVACCVA